MPRKFVRVYAKATGRVQFVPEHFIGHPVLGAGFELTPSARAEMTGQAQPADPDIDDVDLDVDDQTSDDTESSDKTRPGRERS